MEGASRKLKEWYETKNDYLQMFFADHEYFHLLYLMHKFTTIDDSDIFPQKFSRR